MPGFPFVCFFFFLLFLNWEKALNGTMSQCTLECISRSALHKEMMAIAVAMGENANDRSGSDERVAFKNIAIQECENFDVKIVDRKIKRCE